jgi:hypothetical protein
MWRFNEFYFSLTACANVAHFYRIRYLPRIEHSILIRIQKKVHIFTLMSYIPRRSTTELESDVVVEVGEMSFYLHKVSATFLSLDFGLL